MAQLHDEFDPDHPDACQACHDEWRHKPYRVCKWCHGERTIRLSYNEACAAIHACESIIDAGMLDALPALGQRTLAIIGDLSHGRHALSPHDRLRLGLILGTWCDAFYQLHGLPDVDGERAYRKIMRRDRASHCLAPFPPILQPEHFERADLTPARTPL